MQNFKWKSHQGSQLPHDRFTFFVYLPDNVAHFKPRTWSDTVDEYPFQIGHMICIAMLTAM